LNNFTFPSLPTLSNTLHTSLIEKIAGKAKPLGSLGRIEDLSIQIALIQATPTPQVNQIEAFVFAGDHGMNADGVSAFPSAVTGLMVHTFLANKASVNAFAQGCDVEVRVVDAGVDAELTDHPKLIQKKIRKGTRNAAHESALTLEEVHQALQAGIDIAHQSNADALIIGEMGIGNTASAALLMHRLAPAELDDCIGMGAGHDESGLRRKIALITRAAARTETKDPMQVLQEYAGLEIVMMAGALIGGASQKKIMIVDGFISSAAALAAIRLVPSIREYLVFSHVSAERGHRLLLDLIKAKPLLDLGMRLGEGSGGVLVAPMIRAAAHLMTRTASLKDVLEGRLE
jgi:nicotinate-nucleotide--dimethylbenzimidazole phosphoribosyltransferase